MRSLGLSFTGARLFAVLTEQTTLGIRTVSACGVPCGAPLSREEAAALIEEIGKAGGGSALPPAVLSLPPSWTFLRRLELPVPDLARARKIHLSELDGDLPVSEEEILSDLLPPARQGENRFIAVATRRSGLEALVGTLEAAGIRIGRVITDHAAILGVLAEAGGLPSTALLVSFLSDTVVMKLENGRPTFIRQFPPELAASSSAWEGAWTDVLDAAGPGLPVLTLGPAPAALSGHFRDASPVAAPRDVSPDFLPAYGAARAAFDSKVTAGFSLRTSMDAERERRSERRRLRVGIAAAVVAAAAGLFALEAAVWSEGKRVEAVRSLIRKEFAAAAPDVRNIVQPSAQIRERIDALRRQRRELGGESAPPSAWLSRMSQALVPGDTLTVRDIAIEGGKGRLAGEAKSGDAVEKFRASLASAFGPGYNVSIQASEGNAGAGGRRFTILIEQGAGAHGL